MLEGLENGNRTPVLIQVERSEVCMRNLVVALKGIAQDVHGQKPSHKYFNGFIPEKPQTFRRCWMRDGFFVEESQVDKVLDHCHYGGEFLGSAHNECNLKRKTLNFIPMLAHNLSNYDLHLLFKKLRGRMENGSYSINRREIHQFVSSRTQVNILGQERRKKYCV